MCQTVQDLLGHMRADKLQIVVICANVFDSAAEVHVGEKNDTDLR